MVGWAAGLGSQGHTGDECICDLCVGKVAGARQGLGCCVSGTLAQAHCTYNGLANLGPHKKGMLLQRIET